VPAKRKTTHRPAAFQWFVLSATKGEKAIPAKFSIEHSLFRIQWFSPP